MSYSITQPVTCNDLYAFIRASVPMQDVCYRYSIPVRNKTASCPFHAERTASLHIYPDSFYCFGCGAGGDAVKFVAQLLQVSNYEAAKILISEFHLNIPLDSDVSPAAQSARSTLLYEKQLEKSMSEWEKQSFLSLSAYFKQLRTDRIIYAPSDQSNVPHPYFVESLQNLERVEYLLDMLAEFRTQDNTQVKYPLQSKLQMFKSMRNEVKKLAAKIRHSSEQPRG